VANIIDRMTNKITVHPTEKRNMRSMAMNMILKSADMPLFTGTELQAFQVKIGLTTTQMGVMSSYGQIAAAISYFLLMGFSDRIRNQVRVYAVLTAGMMTYPAILLFLSLGPAWVRTPGVAVVFMTVGTVLEAIVMSFLALVFATLFVRTISPGAQAKFMGIMGVGGGLMGMACGLIASQALRVYGYPHGFTVSFAMSVVLLIIAAVVVRNVKIIPELSCATAEQPVSPLSSILVVLKTREFRLLALPNILRGLSGAGGFVMAVGMKQLGLGVEYAGYTTMLGFLGGLLGIGSVGFVVYRFGAGRVLVCSYIGIAISIMGLVLAPSPWVFLVFMTTMAMSSGCEGTTIPLVHFAVIPTQIIGAFSAVRLMLLYGTTALSVAVNGWLLTFMKPVQVFSISATISVTTGILFYFGMNAAQKNRPARQALAS
jgi:MFS family permease